MPLSDSSHRAMPLRQGPLQALRGDLCGLASGASPEED